MFVLYVLAKWNPKIGKGNPFNAMCVSSFKINCSKSHKILQLSLIIDLFHAQRNDRPKYTAFKLSMQLIDEKNRMHLWCHLPLLIYFFKSWNQKLKKCNGMTWNLANGYLLLLLWVSTYYALSSPCRAMNSFFCLQ